MRPDVLANAVATAIRGAVTPIKAEVAALRAELARERAAVADLRQTVAALQDSNKALGKLITRDLEPARHTPCLDDLSPDSAKH